MAFLSSVDIVGSALTAQRYRSDVILQNIANADNTSADGTPYARKQVIFEERPLTFEETLNGVELSSGGVEMTHVVENNRDFKLVYDPTHPHANEEGYVTYSNVDTTEENIDLMAASTAYDANLTALSVLKAMITKTIDMGR